MEEKRLQTADKMKFIRRLHQYCSRSTNGRIRSEFAERIGVSEKSYNNKMYSVGGFRGEELDLVEMLFRQTMGEVLFTEQLTLFLSKACDGDRRTIENVEIEEDKLLQEVNDALATSKVLV